MQVNGRYQQAAQLQLTHPHLNYNANGSNQRYENNMPSNGRGVQHYTMHNVGVCAQQPNNYLALNHPLPARHQNYCNNSAQMATSQSNTRTVSMKQQVMLSQKTSVSGNPHRAARNNMMYYQAHFHLKRSTLNQSVKPSTENVLLQRTNPTTSSTMQQVGFTQQSAVQSPMYSQAFQHAAYAAPPYPPNINFPFSNVRNSNNVQMYSVSPVTLLSTSSANNPPVQNPYFASQTNDNGAIHSANGCTNFSNQTVANNAINQSNYLNVPVQTQNGPHESQKHLQQTCVGGNVNMQIAQPAILASDGNSFNSSSAPLPSQTCLQKQTSAESNLKNMSTASLHITTAKKDHSVNQVDNSLLRHKMNDVSNSLCLHTSLNATSESGRCEKFSKIDTISSAQAKDCSLQVSPGRATRAVAVVLPLSQEGSPSKHSSTSSLQSSNPVLDSCSFDSDQLDKAPVQIPDTYLKRKVQKSNSNGNISADNENVQANSPLDLKQSNLNDAGSKLSSLPLTFAQLVEGTVLPKLAGRRKSKSGNGKTATGQKPCEEELSSLPTTDWTLKMLNDKILELESKENENKAYKDHSPVKEILIRFWSRDCRELLKEIKTGALSNEMSSIRDFCNKIDTDAVILSQNQSNNPSRYQFLSHGEVYEEKKTYTSIWRNINQLDDIDKEFGLPLFLRSSQDDCKSVDSEQKGKLENSSHEIKLPILKLEELLNKEDSPNQTCSSPSVKSLRNIPDSETKDVLRHLDPETEEKAEELECVSDAQSNDSRYSFKIEVLPPEQAKVIFTRMECESPQMEDIAVSKEVTPNDQDSAKDITVSKEVTPNSADSIKDIVSKEVPPNNQDGIKDIAVSKEVTPNEQDHFKDVAVNEQDGSKNIAVSNHVTPNEQDGVDNQNCNMAPIEQICCIDKWKEKVFGLSSEGKCKCAEQSQDEKKVVKTEIENCWSMGIVDLTEDDDIPLFLQESDNAEEDQTLVSTITVSDESENESQVSEDNHSAYTDYDSDHEHDLVIATESQEDMSTNTNVYKTANPGSSQPVSACDDVKENDKRLITASPDPLLGPLKLSKLKSHLKTQTILESFSKSKVGRPVETVELALFGSKHKKSASEGSQQSRSHTRTHGLSEKTTGAPKRLYVKCNFTSDKQEAEPSGNNSVKKRIHESWRNSFPLATVRLKRKNKKYAIVSANHGTTLHLRSTKHTDKRVASKRKSQDSDDGQCRKKRFCTDERTVNTLQKAADDGARCLEENVLKFEVLPNTFNFKEGFCDTDSKTKSKSDEKSVPGPSEESPLIDPAAGSSPSVPVVGTPAEGNPSSVKGAWCDESTSRSSPQSSTSIPESTGLFQEFQRRYKMRQSSVDD